MGKKKFFSILLLMVFVLYSFCFANSICLNERIAYKESLFNTAVNIRQESIYNIVDALPKNFVRNASIDYTEYIQKAIDTHDDIVFPDFPLLINDKGLIIGSNKKIVFKKGSKLILKPSNKIGYNVIRLQDVSNVTLIDPVIIGDRYSHLSNEGQWGYGIGISSSRNITIENPRIVDCWGDGICITRDRKLEYTSQNIKITNAYCKNNRRNGITIGSVSGLKLLSPYAGYSNGHSPESGIDIEPDRSKETLEGIVISNPVTEHNKGDGILMYFANYYGVDRKSINIYVENHRDLFSSNGFRVIAYKLKPNIVGDILGDITFVNPQWKGNSIRALDAMHLNENGLKLKLKGVRISQKNNVVLDQIQTETLLKKSINKISSFQLTP